MNQGDLRNVGTTESTGTDALDISRLAADLMSECRLCMWMYVLKSGKIVAIKSQTL